VKSNGVKKRGVVIRGQVALFISIVLCRGTIYGQDSSAHAKANFDLAIEGPFVVCEAADNQSLLIFTIDPTVKTNPHEDAGLLTDFLDFRLTEGTPNYELKGDLHPGKMTVVNSQKMKRAEFTGSCPTTGYYWSLKVPRPDEVYFTWPESVQLGPSNQCASAAFATYSTRLVLRYRRVDVSKGFQVTDGTNSTPLNVLQIGSDATMVFQMHPIGEHKDHDKDAYAAMATIAGVDSCIYTPDHHQPSMLRSTNNRNGHTDCHAPLIYLAGAKKPAN
jgi:hypothetical protein